MHSKVLYFCKESRQEFSPFQLFSNILLYIILSLNRQEFQDSLTRHCDKYIPTKVSLYYNGEFPCKHKNICYEV